jgi:hypothetical protein
LVSKFVKEEKIRQRLWPTKNFGHLIQRSYPKNLIDEIRNIQEGDFFSERDAAA